MKKAVIPLLALIVLIGIGFGLYTKAQKKLVAEPYVQPYYVALGDSLAAGMGVPPNMGYTDNYYNFLHTKDVKTKYLNLGHGGDTTADLLKIINSNEKEISKATIITVHIGINDIFQKLSAIQAQVPPSELTNTYKSIANNYTNISSKLKKFAPKSKIILLNYYNPFPQDTWFAAHIKNLNNIIKNQTENTGFIYVDTYKLFENTGLDYLMKTNYKEDQIHPNIGGYKAIAKLIQEK